MKVAAVLVSVLSLIACGGSSAPANNNNGDAGNGDAGGSDAGGTDAGGSDAGHSDAGASDGGSDGGTLGDLHVTWTIDGVDADHPTHCANNNVTWVGIRLSPAAPDGGAAVAVDCPTGVWSTGNAFSQLPPGRYTLTFEAHSTPCCTFGGTVPSETQDAVVDAGTSTTSTFNYTAAGH